jgi:hypothetical protein
MATEASEEIQKMFQALLKSAQNKKMIQGQANTWLEMQKMVE